MTQNSLRPLKIKTGRLLRPPITDHKKSSLVYFDLTSKTNSLLEPLIAGLVIVLTWN